MGCQSCHALLVAVALSALYGGMGPSALAVVLVGLVSRDPGVLLAAAALAAVCAIFRRAPPRANAAAKAPSAAPPPDLPVPRFEGPGGGSIAFSSEAHTPPPFMEVTTEATAYLRSFIRSGYRVEDAESQEIDRYGNAKYFVNNLVGIFERDQLVGAWVTQRDVTEQKRGLQSQEYRSRIHSTKSSSQ